MSFGSRSVLSFLLLMLSPFIVSTAWAETAHQHGAHVHGIGQLNVALDDHALLIEWESPAANIVGFEHRPHSEAEKRRVAEAVARLKDAKALFEWPAKAACRVQDVEVHSDLLPGAGEKEDDHDYHDHDEAGHKEDDHDHHDAHEKHEEGESHADFRITYTFHCDHPEVLAHLDVELFRRFPGAVSHPPWTGGGAAHRRQASSDLLMSDRIVPMHPHSTQTTEV